MLSRIVAGALTQFRIRLVMDDDIGRKLNIYIYESWSLSSLVAKSMKKGTENTPLAQKLTFLSTVLLPRKDNHSNTVRV